MNKRLRVLTLVLFAAALLSACANPAYTLYGTWRSTDTTNAALTLEFKQDGHVLETSQGLTQNALFTLSGPNLDTLEIKPTADTADAQITKLPFYVSGDTLTLAVSGQPNPITFTRLK